MIWGTELPFVAILVGKSLGLENIFNSSSIMIGFSLTIHVAEKRW